ncbi:MAG: metal-dependent hydrolase [Myxococcota bacterium]
MPSPLAHVGAALALVIALEPSGARVSWRVALTAAFASVAPDLDILLAVVHPAGLAWHRGPSHSLVGAALIGAVCAWGARMRGRAAWSAVMGAALLHVVFDWSTGEPGAPAHYGVPWAWPIAGDKVIDPTPWFGAYKIDEAGFLANMWGPHAAPVYLWELGTVGALVGAGLAVRRARRGFQRAA